MKFNHLIIFFEEYWLFGATLRDLSAWSYSNQEVGVGLYPFKAFKN